MSSPVWEYLPPPFTRNIFEGGLAPSPQLWQMNFVDRVRFSNLGRQMVRGILKIDPRQQLAGMTIHEDGPVIETSRWDVFFRAFRIRRRLGFRL